MGSFKLEDKSRLGHRKILVFFLVDPTERIVSTEHVLPQNIEWREESVFEALGHKLPIEITRMIARRTKSWMTLEEAKEHRLKLMKERTGITAKVEGEVFELPFDLCEH